MIRTLTLALIVFLVSSAMAGRASSDQQDTLATEETERFVQGFVRFMAYHEAGHLLMQQLEGLHSDPDWTQQDLEAYAAPLSGGCRSTRLSRRMTRTPRPMNVQWTLSA